MAKIDLDQLSIEDLAALRDHDEVRARAVLDEHLRPVAGVLSRLPGYVLTGGADELA